MVNIDLPLRGVVTNEFGEKVGNFWWQRDSGSYTIRWLGVFSYGYTDEGLQAWANALGYYLESVA